VITPRVISLGLPAQEKDILNQFLIAQTVITFIFAAL
jgi:hypothetical protein